MSITIRLSSGLSKSFDKTTLTIGSDPSCDLVLAAGSGVQSLHARLRKIGDRWLLESAGAWPCDLGDPSKGSKQWVALGANVAIGATDVLSLQQQTTSSVSSSGKSSTAKPDIQSSLFVAPNTASDTPPPLPKASPGISLNPPGVLASDAPPPLPSNNKNEGVYSSDRDAVPLSRPSLDQSSRPSSSFSPPPSVVLVREPRLTAFAYSIKVTVDGKPSGSIGGGLPDGLLDLLTSRKRTLNLALSSGDHEIEFVGGGLKRKTAIKVAAGVVQQYRVFFSNLGVLGGGINVVQDSASLAISQECQSPAGNATLPISVDGVTELKSKLTIKGIAKVGILILGLMLPIIGAIRGCGGGSKAGTITFAERVDEKTLETFNEGTHFSMGVVWFVVRGRKPFGDSTLITYGRVHGTEAWAVLGQETVDPHWDTYVTTEVLDERGVFDIKVADTKGVTVASGTVTIGMKAK